MTKAADFAGRPQGLFVNELSDGKGRIYIICYMRYNGIIVKSSLSEILSATQSQMYVLVGVLLLLLQCPCRDFRVHQNKRNRLTVVYVSYLGKLMLLMFY